MPVLHKILKYKTVSNKIKFWKNNNYNVLKENDGYYVYVDQYELCNLFPHSQIKVAYQCNNCGGQFSRVIAKLNKHNNRDYILCNKCRLAYYKSHHEEATAKRKRTNLARYGVENVFSAPHIRYKIEQNNLKKYGKKCIFAVKEFQDKIKQTNLAKYGYENPMQNKEIQEKAHLTNLKKYGNKYTYNVPEIREKIHQTNLQRYGYEVAVNNPTVRKKINTTFKERYNVQNLGEFRYFQRQKDNHEIPISSQQYHLHKILGGILNYQFGKYSLDIAFPDEQIAVEYDGGGHDLSVILGYTTHNEFIHKEIKREYWLISKGWKLIKIISPHDKLLEDNEFIKLVQLSKDYLQNTRHHWINLLIEEDKIECMVSTEKISDILGEL